MHISRNIPFATQLVPAVDGMRLFVSSALTDSTGCLGNELNRINTTKQSHPHHKMFSCDSSGSGFLRFFDLLAHPVQIRCHPKASKSTTPSCANRERQTYSIHGDEQKLIRPQTEAERMHFGYDVRLLICTGCDYPRSLLIMSITLKATGGSFERMRVANIWKVGREGGGGGANGGENSRQI